MLNRLTLLISMTVGVTIVSIVSLSAAPSPAVYQDDIKADFEKRKAALGEEDAPAHFDLALWAQANGLKTDYKRLLRKVIKIDRDHEDARKLLGYEMFDGKWVTAREKVRLEEKKVEEQMLAEGKRKWKNEWHPAEDVEKFEQGLFKIDTDEGVKWVTEIEKERIDQGLVPYQGQWIKAEDKQKIDDGFFPFDDQWLTKEEADKVHSELGKHWQVESEYCNFASTCNYDFMQAAMNDADKTVQSVYRICGVTLPKDFAKIDVMLVSAVEDYNEIGNIATENDDAMMSSCWAAFSAPNPETERFVGVTLYTVLDANNTAGNDNFSKYLVRHAAAECALRSMNLKEDVPRWFVTGLATYLERFSDPWHATGWKDLGGWSAAALQREGGIMKPGQFFEPFNITRQTVLQSGLMVSFLNHSESLPSSVSESWAEVQKLMNTADNKGLNKAFLKLESAIAKDAEKGLSEYNDNLIGG